MEYFIQNNSVYIEQDGSENSKVITSFAKMLSQSKSNNYKNIKGNFIIDTHTDYDDLFGDVYFSFIFEPDLLKRFVGVLKRHEMFLNQRGISFDVVYVNYNTFEKNKNKIKTV
jgi:hypothetical protein